MFISIEIIISILIIKLIYIYIYKIKYLILYNDNFCIKFILLILIFFCIIYIYISIKNIEIFLYSNNLFVIDKNNLLIKILLLIQFIILCILWPNNKLISNIETTIKLLILLLFSILGLCIAINARDLILLYMGMELASIPIYILVSNKEYMISIEAGLKYFIFGAISSCFFLLGLGFIYGLVGSTFYNILYIYEIYAEEIDNYYIFLIFIFIIILFLFKIGIYPFNFWINNFNEGATLNIIFFLSIIPKLPYIYILILLFFTIFNKLCFFHLYVILILINISFITILNSIIQGLSDNNIGRIIGQSSMINMSHIFILILCLVLIQETFLFFIFLFYFIPTLLLFSLLSIKDISISKRNFTVIYDIFLINQYLIILLYFTLISLSGLPFLAGFIGKWYILKLLIDYNYLKIIIFLVFLSIFINIFYSRIFFYIINRIRFNNFKILKEKFLKFFLISFLGFINFSLILLQEPILGCILNLL
jgi:NADH-quinone oxidoreductase subunit N